MLLVGQLSVSLEKIKFDGADMNFLSYAEGVSLFKDLSDTFTDTIAKAMEIEMLESIQSLLQHSLDDVVKFMKSSFVKTRGVCEQVMTEFKTATEDSTLATLQPLIQCDEFPNNKAEFLALLQHSGAIAMFSAWRSVSTFGTSWKDIAHGVVCVFVFMFRLQSYALLCLPENVWTRTRWRRVQRSPWRSLLAAWTARSLQT